MPDLAKLRREHAQLLEIIGRLSLVIAEPRPSAAANLHALRNELASALIRHLKGEDWVLYPRLLASPDASVQRTARTFNDEMGGLAHAYNAYAHKWTATSIEADWAGYCEDTRAIIEALTQRINREDRELYPLVRSVEKAA